MAEKTKRIAAFSCLHAPITHKGYFDWLLAQIEEYKPHYIVNLGDWYEGLASKRWSRYEDEEWSVYDEHRAVAAQAQAINEVAPQAEKWWLWGNHDDNLLGDLPDRVPKDLREAVNWRNFKPTADALDKWNCVENYGDSVKLRLGPITFQHGCAHNESAEKDAAYLYGVPFGLYVCGHTHRLKDVTQAKERKIPMPYWYCNPGTGMDFERANYMRRQRLVHWGRGVALIEAPGVDQSRAAYRKVNWSAEVKVHSLADERFK